MFSKTANYPHKAPATKSIISLPSTLFSCFVYVVFLFLSPAFFCKQYQAGKSQS